MGAPIQERLQRYKEILLAWNEKVNLIGPEAVRNLDAHIEEAVHAAEILRPAGEVLDVGSGGGLPGIPMAIVSPGARFHLVDSDQRKWAFLKHVVRECSLNSQVYGDRLSRVVARLPPGLRFTLVTSRAVGHLESWLPDVTGRLSEDGRVALFQREKMVPNVAGLRMDQAVALPRGESNFLLILKRFHVEHD